MHDPLPSTNPLSSEHESRHTLIVGRHIDGDTSNRSRRRKHRSLTLDPHFDSSSISSFEGEQIDHEQFLSNSQLFSAQQLYIRPWLVRRATAPNIHCLDTEISDTRIETLTNRPRPAIETFFSIFPRDQQIDLYTRYTCLITFLFYLRDIHDKHSNRILYDEITAIENDLKTLPHSSSPHIYSNVFQTFNPYGSKRYRTGFVFGINGSPGEQRVLISSKQIQWKRVKVLVRRFRKKFQRHHQLMRNETQKDSNQLNIDHYLEPFDSTSSRRIQKYAKHYAEKV